MLAQVSQFVVLALGITVFALSVWGMYSPAALVKMVTQVMDQSLGMYIAVIVRLILGVALIFAAPASHFPTAFHILGWIAIIAAVVLIVVGREGVRSIIAWFQNFSTSTVRTWLLFGMAFAAFLIYGVL